MDLMTQRIETLTKMLPDLIFHRTPLMISDGTANGTFGMIQYMATAGGNQYGLRQISSRGCGGGQYFRIGQEDDLVLATLAMLEDIEKPHPLTQKLIAEGRMEKPKPLGFHFLTEETTPLALRRMMG